MNRQQFWQSCQVGATYIGTVVGAGFASGQEVYQFFGRFGNWGYIAVLLAIFLFWFLGTRLMVLGHNLKAQSFTDLNHFLFGERVGRLVDIAFFVMLFGVTVTMLAGVGELFRERLHLSFQWGALLTMLLTYLTVVRGISGILKANIVIVPVMITFVLLAGYHSLLHHGSITAWQYGHGLTAGHPVMAGLSAVLYVSMNAGLASGVLVPLGANMKSTKSLRGGAQIGAVGLGLMLGSVVLSLFTFAPESLQHSLPMAYIATKMGPVLQWLFILVLWAEIFSTLVGNVYALGTQWKTSSRARHRINIAMVLLAAYACSQIGFSAMVKYAYTFFGFACVLVILALIWPREKLPES